MKNFTFLCLTLAFTTVASAKTIELKNLMIVDPVMQTIKRGAVVVKDGIIEDVVVGNEKTPSRKIDETHDLEGKWVIPGLVDMHTHAWGNTSPGGTYQVLGIDGAAKMMERAGITAFLDLLNDETEIFPLRKRQRAGQVGGAQIFAAGPCLTAPKAHCSEFGVPTRIVESPQGAAAEVREISKLNPDVIKLVYDHAIPNVPTMSKETMEAVISKAKELSIKTVVHIGTWDDAREAAIAGADAITHLYKEVVPEDVVAVLKKHKVFMIPTVAVQSEMLNVIENPAFLEDSFLKEFTTPDLLSGYQNIDVSSQRMRFYLDYLNSGRKTNPATLKALADAGIEMMTGTDIGNNGTFVGFTLHREMELFVKYGLSSWQALKAAMISPGNFLGKKFGIQKGDEANLLILDASPVEDIVNTRKIHMVLNKGVIVHKYKSH